MVPFEWIFRMYKFIPWGINLINWKDRYEDKWQNAKGWIVIGWACGFVLLECCFCYCGSASSLESRDWRKSENWLIFYFILPHHKIKKSNKTNQMKIWYHSCRRKSYFVGLIYKFLNWCWTDINLSSFLISLFVLWSSCTIVKNSNKVHEYRPHTPSLLQSRWYHFEHGQEE